jgi:hypothetical protein
MGWGGGGRPVFRPEFKQKKWNKKNFLGVFPCFSNNSIHPRGKAAVSLTENVLFSFRVTSFSCYLVHKLSGWRIHIILMQIRVQLFTIMRIRIQLFTLMRTWFQILIKVME